MIDTSWLRFLLVPASIFIPGFIAFRVWGRSLHRRLPLSETLYLQVLVSIVVTSYAGLFLAAIGLFTVPACLITLILACSIPGWICLKRRRLRDDATATSRDTESTGWKEGLRGLKRQDSVQLGLVILLVLVGTWLNFRPAEAFLILDDSGVYVLSGISLAETGGLLADDPLIKDFTLGLDGELLSRGRRVGMPRRFPGAFYLWNWGVSAVSFGFLHLYRIWIAFFALVFGRLGALYATPAFALLSIVGMPLLGRRLFSGSRGSGHGTWIGILGAGLLTLNFTQIWNARYPLTEVMTQSLIIGGFYLLALVIQYRTALLSAACGLCFASLFLARVDTVPLIAFVYLFLALWKSEHALVESPQGDSRDEVQSPKRVLLIFLTAGLAYASMHNLLYAHDYLIDLTFGGIFANDPTLILSFAIAGLGVILVSLWLALKPETFRRFRRIVTLRPWRVGWLILTTSLALMLAFFLLFPALWPFVMEVGNPHWSLLSWTPLGLILATAGLALFLVRREEAIALPFWVFSVLSILSYAMNPFVTPRQPWASRRLIPVVLPALAMFSAYAVVNMPRLRFRLHRVIRVLVIVALVGLFIRTDLPFLRATEYRGCLDRLQDLASHFEGDSVILFDGDGPATNAAQALHYLFGLDTFVLQKRTPDTEVIKPFLARWWEENRPAYLIVSGESLEWYPPDLAMIPETYISFALPRIEPCTGCLPSRIQEMRFNLDVYRLVPLRRNEDLASTWPTRLEMANGEYPYLRDGLHRMEMTPDGTTFRWTNGSARLLLGVPQGAERYLRLRVAGGRNGGVEPPALSVWAGDTLIGQAALDGSHNFTVLEFLLPEDLTARLGDPSSTREIEIELRSDSWVPGSVTDSTDPRTLGVAVDWVEVTSGQ